MEEISENQKVSWDGGLPEGGGHTALLEAGFIPVECKAGDLLAFSGQLDHSSIPNFSYKPRHILQLHLVEGEKAGVSWCKYNWLQYPSSLTFIRLLE
jgi:phytanoyl-CoA hydroxylase